MLIGLDGIPLTELKTGIGHYTFELAKALARVAPESDFELVYPSTYPAINLSDKKPASSLPVNLKNSRVQVGPIGRHWWSVGLPRYIRSARVELFHGTNYDVPLRRRCATVLTLHDLSQLTHPATHDKRSVRRARRRIPVMARAGTMIITPTQSVRLEVCDHLGVNPEKVCAVPEAPRDCFRPLPKAETEETRRRLGIEGHFLLTVGTIEPRKNLGALVRAFAEVLGRAPQSKLQLVVVGKKGWLSDPLFAQLEESGLKDRIVVTGYLPDEDLCALYSSCLLFVYPSIYEGFGLPPLEAMACGAPVIAGRVPALVETTGGAAHLVDCESNQDLVRAIVELIENENGRETLAAAGRRHASGFSWERTAQSTLEVYKEALKRFRG